MPLPGKLTEPCHAAPAHHPCSSPARVTLVTSARRACCGARRQPAKLRGGSDRPAQGVTSPLVGQMFFRATLFGAFGWAKRWLATNPDGSTRPLTTLDFYKARLP